MPGYARYDKMRRATTNSVSQGALTVTWREKGEALEYTRGGRRYRYEIARRMVDRLHLPGGIIESAAQPGNCDRPRDIA